MKTKDLIPIIFLISAISMNGQSQEYYSLMKNNIDFMNEAASIEDYQSVANLFQRYSFVCIDDWHSSYYCSYCYVQMSYLVEDKNERDRFIEEARRYLSMSDSISPENSEIYVLKGFILQACMNIEKMTRGMKYNNECLAMFKKAEKLNPENPRSYLWHAVQLINIPAFMGGGKKKALPYLELSLKHFKSFVPESEISPNWGHNYAIRRYEELIEEQSLESY